MNNSGLIEVNDVFYKWRTDVMKEKVGVLTGGGDCPGLNSVIRAVTRKLLVNNYDIVGIKNGWMGILENEYIILDRNAVGGILHRGGTILGTSRTNPKQVEGGLETVRLNMAAHGLNCLIVIGGEDTLGVAAWLHDEGIKVVGVPKTIDNDLSGTDQTFGFDTAVSIATEAIDRLHSTAESHHRVIVVEVMGRHAGWIALWSGVAGGADFIMIPEVRTTVDELINVLKKRHEDLEKDFSIVVVSEGAKFIGEEGKTQLLKKDEEVDEFGHVKLGGIGHKIGAEIKARTNYDTRVSVLGHIQRGGSPTAFDRVLATRYGVRAAELVIEGKWGMMASLDGNKIKEVPIKEAVKELRTVDKKYYEIAKTFFG